MNIVSEKVYVEQKVGSFGPMSRKGIPKSYAGLCLVKWGNFYGVTSLKRNHRQLMTNGRKKIILSQE